MGLSNSFNFQTVVFFFQNQIQDESLAICKVCIAPLGMRENFINQQVPKVVMTVAKDHSRIFELLTALVMTLAMAALISVVQRYSSTPVPELPDFSQDPIIVFPDFASVESVAVKKQQFFDYLQAYVDAENAKISQVRGQLLNFAAIADSGVGLSRRERLHLLQIAQYYELETELRSDREIINALLPRVDVIPASLVLAQAASESAWGTSRFALEGYNIFGQWCYVAGCGIVPERRIGGAVHEVKRFDSIASSVEAYFVNINSHHLYQEFRDMRANMRRQKRELDPMELAYGLGRYSSRGEHYIDEVQVIIKQNALQQRDRS